MNQIQVDFEQVTGKIKPLHSVCCAPYSKNSGPNQRYISKMFTEGYIPYCRLHDCCGSYGGGYFVDVPNIFRNFHADENDPASYDFHYTDEYIGAIQASGCEAYYRLGVTIEWGSRKYVAHPPEDFAKWARICEHIIMHYNEGWANGFYYNLTFWEIWNEPENPGNSMGRCMWTGTSEEFFELYKITSIHLKNRFPHLKIGGYGSCGFYAITRENASKDQKEFVSYFKDFLRFVKANNCPLDFYSWHIYTADEKELLAHAKYVRETLDENGFQETESHLNEWNIHAEGVGFLAKHTLEGASFNAAVLCLLQNTPYVDMAMYYCFSLSARYNGFIDHNNFAVCPPWYSFVAYGNLYRLSNSVKVETEGDGIYAAAAKIEADLDQNVPSGSIMESEYGILVVNYRGSDAQTTIHVSGMKGVKMAQVLLIDESHTLEEAFSFTVYKEAEIKLKLSEQTIAYIAIK